MQAWPHLIQGIRFEVAGALEQALESYGEAAKHSADNDWQAFFRLAIIHAERGEVPIASRYAQEVLHRAPQFPFRKDLERLVAMGEGV
jgi:tetratricopeptide (TPR) repeat protein